MAQIPPIEDGYIDGVIKSNVPYNPTLNQTQGVKLRELVKLLRDRLEQEIAENHQIFTAALEAKVDKEAGKGLSQENFTLAFKNKLEELALMGIPAGPVDTIGTPVSENSPKLFYNTTSRKLRIYDPASMTWRDVIEADLTNYYTKNQIDDLIAAIPTGANSLQELTTGAGNNVTNNSLFMTGNNNIPTSGKGTYLAYQPALEAFLIQNLKAIGGIQNSGLMLGQETVILSGGTTHFALRNESASLSGAHFEARVSGAIAINDYDFVTKVQLDSKETILIAPDNSKWKVSVDNNGSLTTTKII